MRTTLELDDDLVVHARQLAREQGLTLGRVISDLARRSLAVATPGRVRNGAMLFVPAASLEIVNALRDDA